MDAFIGEIRPFAFGFIPDGWYGCFGQELQINSAAALFSIIGNTWGGTPGKTFKLPNLQCLSVMGAGTGPGLTPRPWGATTVGANSVTLNYSSQLPNHTHTMTVQVPLTQTGIQANAQSTPTEAQSWLSRPYVIASANLGNSFPAYTKFASQSPTTTLHPATIASACGNASGGVDAHENRQPYLAMIFAISYDGVYPSRD